MPKKSISKKLFSKALYIYVEPNLAKAARKKGYAEFGSLSAYINYLMAKDTGNEEMALRISKMADDFYEGDHEHA